MNNLLLLYIHRIQITPSIVHIVKNTLTGNSIQQITILFTRFEQKEEKREMLFFWLLLLDVVCGFLWFSVYIFRDDETNCMCRERK